MKIDLSNFDWGPLSEDVVLYLKNEIFDKINNGERSDYEKFFEVEEGDIVLDIGATVGDFGYSILHKKPKHIYVVEPIGVYFDAMKRNLEGYPVSFTNAAISNEKSKKIWWMDHEQVATTLTFKEYINLNRLHKIDFLKIDIEGGEYSILTQENLEILKSIPKISIECHLGNRFEKEYFRIFRDTMINEFKRYEIFSLDFVDIKWELWQESFLEYYGAFYLFIDNR